jgi:hypothetical protein
MIEHAPVRGLVLSIEGTRSYGVGQPARRAPRGLPRSRPNNPPANTAGGKGKSDRIDAHLAVLYALGLDAAKLPTPRSDGDREALRILLCARQELTTTSTGQTNRLRALLRDGDDTDHRLARARLTDTVLASLTRRRPPTGQPNQRGRRVPLSSALEIGGSLEPREAGGCLPGSASAQLREGRHARDTDRENSLPPRLGPCDSL